jgi:hypothetical protein
MARLERYGQGYVEFRGGRMGGHLPLVAMRRRVRPAVHFVCALVVCGCE